MPAGRVHTYDDSDGDDDYYYPQNARAERRRSEQQWQKDRRAERVLRRREKVTFLSDHTVGQRCLNRLPDLAAYHGCLIWLLNLAA